MRRLALAFAVGAALLGCDPPDRGNTLDSGNTLPDASGATDGAIVDPERMPFTTTGTTPAGSLDDVQFMSVRFIGGNCPGTYYLKLYRTDDPGDSELVTFDVTLPPNTTEPPTGTIMAEAQAGGVTTDEVTFEIT